MNTPPKKWFASLQPYQRDVIEFILNTPEDCDVIPFTGKSKVWVAIPRDKSKPILIKSQGANIWIDIASQSNFGPEDLARLEQPKKKLVKKLKQ